MRSSPVKRYTIKLEAFLVVDAPNMTAVREVMEMLQFKGFYDGFEVTECELSNYSVQHELIH